MIRSALATAFALFAASPALATEWVNCSDRDGAASIDILLGSLGTDVIALAGLVVSVGEQVWASHVEYGPGDIIVAGQAFETDTFLFIDAMDENLVSKVAELRLHKTSEGDGPLVYGGTLRIPGHGAWAVSCSGP